MERQKFTKSDNEKALKKDEKETPVAAEENL